MKVGLITIGQTPREDMLNMVFDGVINQYDIVQYGALDEINYIKAEYFFKPHKPKGQVFSTKLRNGNQIKIDEYTLLPLLEKAINKIEIEFNPMFTILMCTGEYKTLEKYKKVIRPYRIAHSIIDLFFEDCRLGILVPSEEQIKLKKNEWSTDSRDVYIESVSPYSSIEFIIEKVDMLLKNNVDCIFLDCFGFSKLTATKIKKYSQLPVLSASSLINKVVVDLV